MTTKHTHPVIFGLGDRVTRERPTWHDGSPVLGWPVQRDVGYIESFHEGAGVQYARVCYTQKTSNIGRYVRADHPVDELHLVEAYR